MTEDLKLDFEEFTKAIPKEEVEARAKTYSREDLIATIEKTKRENNPKAKASEIKATEEEIQEISEGLARAEIYKEETDKREWIQCSMLYQEEIDTYLERKEDLFSKEQMKEYRQRVIDRIQSFEDEEGEYSYIL